MAVAWLASSFYDDHPRLSRFLVFASAPILVLLLYLPALGNGLVWDDHLTFEQTAAYRHASLGGIFIALGQPLVFDANYFRPLTLLTFLLQVRLFGVDAFGLHLVSLLLHATNTFLLSLLLWKIFNRQTLAARQLATWLGALVYGMHPALTEPAVFISARFDLLATFFMVSILLVDESALKPASRYSLTAILFLLAALSKEMALALPLCLPFLHVARMQPAPGSFREIIKRLWTEGRIYTYVALIIGGLIYLGIRYVILGYLLLPDSLARTDIGGFANHAALVGKSITTYLGLILAPFANISVSHPAALPIGFGDPSAWIGLAVALGAILLSVRLANNFVSRAGWSLLAVIASLLPVLNLVPTRRPADVFFSETFLPFPVLVAVTVTACLSLGASGAGRSLFSDSGKRLAAVVIAPWMLLGIITIATNIPLWRNDLTLWTWVATKQHFRNQTAVTNMVNGLILEKRFPEAVAVARKAVRNFPDNDNSWNSLAIALSATGSLKEAEQAHLTAIQLVPDESRYHSAYGGTLIKLSRLEEAKKEFQLALKFDPHNTNALLGSAYLADNAGDLDAAVRFIETVISYTPPGAEKDRYKQWLSDIAKRKSGKK